MSGVILGQKISFVTTVTKFDQIRQIINFFYEEKIPEIFLRPVNYHGFARKSFQARQVVMRGG